MNLVIFRHPLWVNSNNGSITCLTNFLQDYSVTDSPWILVVLKKLEFDLNNKYHCNDKCLKTLKNQVQTFYVYDFRDTKNIIELSRHLIKFNSTFNFYSVDSIGGYFCHQLRGHLVGGGLWTHLSTLHNTKNIKLLEEHNHIQKDNNLYDEELLKEKTFVEESDIYVTVSQSEKRWVSDVLGRKKTIKVYYPTLKWWYPTPSTKIEPFYIREKYPNKKIFLFIGRITYQKGIDKLLNVRWPENSHLCIMSALEFCDIGLTEKTKEFCERNSDTVSWIGPHYGDNKFNVIKQCDAVITSSIYEPFGLVGLETMLFTDTLFISSAVDGMKDYITEGGYLDCGTTVEQIQQAVDRFLELSEEEKSSIVQKGKNGVKNIVNCDNKT
jgi:glycosyltransferase involved in cell wall biosynthesis